MNIQFIRQSLYGYISAMEVGAREIVSDQIFIKEDFISLVSKTRLAKLRIDSIDTRDKLDVLDELSFGEPWELIITNVGMVDPKISDAVNSFITDLPNLVKARNAVMHSKPIKHDFIDKIMNAVEVLVKTPGAYFESLKRTAREFKLNPAAVLDVNIPVIKEEDRIPNNLPIPDFDETGLVGRENDLEKFLKLIKGPWPVISIVGEGAIGKTALALTLAYEILEDKSFSFDKIVWMSAKANKLLPTEIKELNNTIKSGWDLLDQVSDSLGAEKASKDHYKELLEYLNTFKILLIIDNLETIMDEELSSFISNMNSRDSKIVITSRIGLGNFEQRETLGQLEARDAVTLLRTLSKARSVDFLTKCSNQQLVTYCEKLLKSPGFIKWFVSLVQVGVAPEKAIADKRLFLDFALENVFNHLSDDAKYVLQCMCTKFGSNTVSEISFLTGFDGDKLRKLFIELSAANLIVLNAKQTENGAIGQYDATALTRFYVLSKFPLKSDKNKELRNKLLQIRMGKEEVQSQKSGNRVEDPYALNTIIFRTEDDVVAGKFLRLALQSSKEQNMEKASEYISEAKRLAPEFPEVYRVSAFINDKKLNYTGAQEDFDVALELNSSDPRILFWYGGFQYRALENLDAALLTLKKAKELDPSSVSIKIELSRINTFLENYDMSLKILIPLKDDLDLSVKHIRQIGDAIVSNYKRKMSRLKINTLFNEGIKLLEEASNQISTLQKRSIDRKVAYRISQLIQESDFLYAYAVDEKETGKLDQSRSILHEIELNVDRHSSKISSTTGKEINQADPVSDEEVGKLFVGTVYSLPYQKDFGFLFCERLIRPCFFRKYKNNFGLGQKVSFELAEAGPQPKAKIKKRYPLEDGKQKTAIIITNIREDRIDCHTSEGRKLTSSQYELERLLANWRMMEGQEILANILEIPKDIVTGPNTDLAYNIELSKEQDDAFSIRNKIDVEKLYEGEITELLKSADAGRIYMRDLEGMPVEIKFSKRSIKQPIAFDFLEEGRIVSFNLNIRSDGSLEATSLNDPTAEYPKKGGLEYKGRITTDIRKTNFGFGVVANTWTVFIHPQQFIDKEDWEKAAKGMEVSFRLQIDDQKRYNATEIRLL